MNKHVLTVGLAAALLGAGAGCAKNGMGAPVRNDISGRMTAAQPSITSCYGAALQRSRKLRGMIVLSVTAEATTGQFKNVRVDHDELGDAELRKCVLDEVSKLKLDAPQKTNITFSYPLRFSPTK
ncbi:MAG: AgmX/PglI C-terminal domain-containing protein [Kofleriaceae bacterium]